MRNTCRYQYYVEGECEKKLINELKKAQLVLPGTINVFNVKQRVLSGAYLTNISRNTIVILVFDTDTDDIELLKRNIEILNKCSNVIEIWHVMQVLNLEEELFRVTDIREPKDLLGCRNNSDFKRDFIKEKNLLEKMQRHGFDIERLWISKPGPVYDGMINCGYRIKKAVKREK